jgi:hypothetical protein
VKSEQPSFREEGVGPALMIRCGQSHAGTPERLLAQERTQSPPDELIERAEGVRVRVLEVGEPAAQQPVEINDDDRERLPARSSCLLPDAVLEPVQTLS